jgi:hypothetical protein
VSAERNRRRSRRGRPGEELLGLRPVPGLLGLLVRHRDPSAVVPRPRLSKYRRSALRGSFGLSASYSATACSGTFICSATPERIPRSRNGTPSRSATRGPTTCPPAPKRAARVTTGATLVMTSPVPSATGFPSAQPEQVLPGPGDDHGVRIGRPRLGLDLGRVAVVQVQRPHPALRGAGGRRDPDPRALSLQTLGPSRSAASSCPCTKART